MPRKKINIISNSNDLLKNNIEISETNKTNETETTNKTNGTNGTNETNKKDIPNDIIDIKQLKGKEIWYYDMLDKYFSTCETFQIQRMIDIINGEHTISLRFLDWFVTRYCDLYKTTIIVKENTANDNYSNFNINISYAAQLKSVTKKYFDPFKRNNKFYFTLEKQKISFLTTLGQLNFFRWAISNDIINYTITNYKNIMLKYDYVNSFFKKHNSCNSSNSTKYTTVTSNTSNISNKSDTIETIDTEKTTDTKELNKVSNINNNNNNVVIDNCKNKSSFKIPRVSRNIYIEI